MCGLALSAGGAYAYYFDSTRTEVIAVGVQIAGIDVGGLHAADARHLVDARLAQRLREPVHIVYGLRRFTVHPMQAGLHVDIARMVDAASIKMASPVLPQRSRYALLSMGPTAILVTVRPSISRVSGGPPTRTSPEYVTFKTYTERPSLPRPAGAFAPVAGRRDWTRHFQSRTRRAI